MPSTYYSDSSGQKKGLPVSAHSHALDRTQFSNVGISNDGSVTDPLEGQGIYWVGNPPDDPNPGKWFAGDAPTKAPVSETVLANWFEPTSWRPPGVDNPDGAAGTWRPVDPVASTPGNIFSWRNPGDFGIASETVNGYIRLQTTSDLTVEWGAEVNSGARPIAYGAAGTQSAGEYVYKLSALCMALKDKDGAVGPWKVSLGMAFYTNNVARDSDGHAPQPSLSKHIVWGVNEYDLTTTSEPDQWVSVECYMNGRVQPGDVPSDAPIGGALGWRNTDPDAPEDGYYFAPIIKVTGANADVLIDSVQVFRGQNQLLAPGGVITSSVTTDQLTVGAKVSTSQVELTPQADAEVPKLTADVLTNVDNDGNSVYFTKAYGFGFAFPQDPPVGDPGGLLFSWNDTPDQTGTDAKLAINDTAMEGIQTVFRAGNTYRFEATVTPSSASAAPYYLFVGFLIAGGPLQTPQGTDPEEYTWDWVPDQDYVLGTDDVSIGLGVQQADEVWANAGTHTLNQFQMTEIGDIPGTIVGLGDPANPSDPVTKGWFESQDLGGGNTNVVHVPDDTEPEPVEDPEEPFEDGSLWLNPTAQLSIPYFFYAYVGGNTTITDGSWSDIPNWERVQFNAPTAGVLKLNGRVLAQTSDYQTQVRLYPEVDSSDYAAFWDSGDLFDFDGRNDVTLDHIAHPVAYVGFDKAGVVVMKFQSAITSGFVRGGTFYNGRLFGEWYPNALFQSSENPGGSQAPQVYAPFARVRDGGAWKPESGLSVPGWEKLDPTVTIVNVSTSSSISGGGTQNGGSRTLTATVSSGSGTPVGQVQFKKNGSTFSTKTLSSGKATVSVSSSGSYSISYLGGTSGANNYQPSSSGSTNVTIRSLQTKSVTRSLKWNGQYPSTNNQQSDYYNHIMRQGRYSSTWGNWRTLWGFDGVGGVSNLNDATKVELQNFRIDHSYYGGGADLDLGWHTRSSRPGTYTVGSGQENRGGYYRSQGTHTIDISSWAKGRVTRSDFGGIVVGSGSSGNLNHYCYNSSTSPKLKITYRQWV